MDCVNGKLGLVWLFFGILASFFKTDYRGATNRIALPRGIKNIYIWLHYVNGVQRDCAPIRNICSSHDSDKQPQSGKKLGPSWLKGDSTTWCGVRCALSLFCFLCGLFVNLKVSRCRYSWKKPAISWKNWLLVAFIYKSQQHRSFELPFVTLRNFWCWIKLWGYFYGFDQLCIT